MSTAIEASPAAGREPVALCRHPAFRLTLLAAGVATASSPLWWGPVSGGLLEFEFAVSSLLPEAAIANASWFILPGVGFGAGLLASLSPCILPLVPLNVAYIGAADVSGWRAAALSGRFVLGAAAALALLGLAGDLAGVLLIEQRGPVLLGVGAALLYFGLAALEIVPIPFSGRDLTGQRRFGAFGAGAAFSLVTTPCASPLLAAILTAATAQAIPGLTVASMLGFALGYTALVFAAGVFGGNLVRSLRDRSFEAPRAAAGALLLVLGLGFGFSGARWFF